MKIGLVVFADVTDGLADSTENIISLEEVLKTETQDRSCLSLGSHVWLSFIFVNITQPQSTSPVLHGSPRAESI